MHLEFFSQETRKTIREYKSTLLYIQVEGISSIVLYPISNFSTVVLAVICNIKKNLSFKHHVKAYFVHVNCVLYVVINSK